MMRLLRSRSRRALVAVVLALGLTASSAGIAAADDIVVAINTKDGSSIFKFGFHISRVMGDVVDQTNAAVAVSSCADCQTVAVAIEVVLIMSDASVITPTNEAIALNYQCTACETLASALQFVLSTGGPVHFTADGNKEIADIRKELHDLAHSNLPPDEILQKLDGLKQRLAQVLSTQLVPAGNPKNAGSSPAPSESPSPSPSAVPSGSPSAPESPASPSGSSTPEPSPSSSPS